MIPDEIEIDVTARDIAEGKPGKCERCPIALAVRRIFPNDDIRVDSIIWIGDNWDARFDTPEVACDFIDRFDSGQEVSPFKFTAVRR